MLGDAPPVKPNMRGARWNPPDVAALYASLDRETAIAEGDHLLSMQPLRPTAARRLYAMRAELGDVLDLRDEQLLLRLGVDADDLSGTDFSACQMVGGAAAWLGIEAIIVPSARADGGNLVIFVRAQDADSALEIRIDEALP